jgi:hypothetical protein
MMMLGGDLGWDLQHYEETAQNGTETWPASSPDPRLSYDQIASGWPGVSSGCEGAGSVNGIINGNQSISARLTIAQHNPRHITASEANGILRMIHALKNDAKSAATECRMEDDLTPPLREAAKLIERAKLPGRPGVEGSISAATPTRLLELFVRRVELNAADLGKRHADRLAAGGYELIAQLEGQTQTR